LIPKILAKLREPVPSTALYESANRKRHVRVLLLGDWFITVMTRLDPPIDNGNSKGHLRQRPVRLVTALRKAITGFDW
jgi:hypothetical protein